MTTAISLSSLTDAQNDVLSQLVYLDNHFKTKHNIECFSQSVSQIMRRLGYCRKTIQTAFRKLEEIGVISIAYNQGFHGSNLFYIHLDKLEELRKESLDHCTNATEKVKNIFWRFIVDSLNHTKQSPDLNDLEQAQDFVAYARDTFTPEYFQDAEDYAAITLLDTALNGDRYGY
ncbi:hypothetical protein EX461_23950 [Vibrio parahaemolyticus]|nr:hypothetical protein [Vibrio parahaemolyticus]EJG0013988.1 helix-turn-helix domain-containing protein [Vibrio parahaemolyticus]EJG0782029.1 helix-turn-helix domain-containing protein [Vibrio parahaemolyticus]EJS9799239.1 helix-turn-helix domain-containing protein [Vibrio parahaemolyticus]